MLNRHRRLCATCFQVLGSCVPADTPSNTYSTSSHFYFQTSLTFPSTTFVITRTTAAPDFSNVSKLSLERAKNYNSQIVLMLSNISNDGYNPSMCLFKCNISNDYRCVSSFANCGNFTCDNQQLSQNPALSS